MKPTVNLSSGLRLKSSLQKGAIFPILLAIMVTLGLFIRSEQTGKARERLNAAQMASAAVLEFNLATSALVSGDSSMNLKIWEHEYNRLKSFLNENENRGLVAHYTVVDIQHQQENIREKLQTLANGGFIATERVPSSDRFGSAVYRAAVAELSTAMKDMADAASNEASISRTQLKVTERLANNILLVFVAIFSMLMAAATITNSQQAVTRLRRLKEVAVAAAAGDYSNRIKDVGANDEIGQILRSFNAMVAKFSDAFGVISTELSDVKKNSTDSRKTADAARESNMRLADALTRLKRAQGQMIQQERLQALQQVANGMAKNFHDAIEPILSSSDYLLSYPEQRKNEEELLENLKLINSAASLAHTEVRRLAAVFKSPENTEIQCVDIRAVIDKAIKLAETRRMELEKEKGIKISCVTSLGTVPAVQAIEADLEDAVVGMMINSFESFSSNGQVNISIEVDDGNVVLTIKDNGSGMSDEISGKAIEPFFSTKGDDHSGMGLTTALTAAGHFGGSFDIKSNEKSGTTVVISLPSCSDEAAKKEDRSEPVKKLNILVVDDEEWILKILIKCLSVDGHTVDSAGRGADGLKLLEEKKHDVAIIDWALPDMSGDELARSAIAASPETGVIILSGFGDEIKKEGLAPEGVKVVMSKPVTMEQLRRGVAEAVS